MRSVLFLARICFGGSTHVDKFGFLITSGSSLNNFSKFVLHRRFVAVEKHAVCQACAFLEVPTHFDKISFVIDEMSKRRENCNMQKNTAVITLFSTYISQQRFEAQ